jgi:ketosteroid isomerase-like protein
MRHFARSAALTILALLLHGCVLRSVDRTAEVREAVRAYFQALNDADPTAIMDMFSRNPEVTSTMEGEIVRGWESIRVETDKMTGEGEQRKWSPGAMEVLSLGSDHALVVIPIHITLTSALGKDLLEGATTLVLERVDGKWKILHEHHSLQEQDTTGDWDSSRG